MREKLTYIKVPNDGSEPKFFEMPELVIDELKYKKTSSRLIGDFLFETYVGYKSNGVYFPNSKGFLLKRNTEDFTVEDNIIFLSDHSTPINFGSKIKIYGESKGLFILASDPESKGNGTYLKRFDFDLKELWTVDLSGFFPEKNESAIGKVSFDKYEETLIFEVNLKACEDCGFFDRKKKVKSAVNGLFIFDHDGEVAKFIPELDGQVLYSRSEYFYNRNKKQLTGIYFTHEPGKDQYSPVVGLGLGFFQWDIETSELIKSIHKEITYGDVIDDKGQEYLNKISKKGTFDPNKNIANFSSKNDKILKLENGSFLINYFHLYNDEISGLASCTF